MSISARKRKADGSRSKEEELLYCIKNQSPIVINTPARKVRAKASSTANNGVVHTLFKCDEGFNSRTRAGCEDQIFFSRRASAPSKPFILQSGSQPSSMLNSCLPALPTPIRTCEKLEAWLPMYTPGNVEEKSVKRSLFYGHGGSLQIRTPMSLQRTRYPASSKKLRLKAEATMQLRAIENQELRALRCENAKRAVWMRRQERGYTVWLNFLLKQPMNGTLATTNKFLGSVMIPNLDHDAGRDGKEQVAPFMGLASPIRFSSFEVETFAQTPKSDLNIHKTVRSFLNGCKTPIPKEKKGNYDSCSSNGIDSYLQAVCNLTDLRRRLAQYFEQQYQEEYISIIMHLAKNIDEGRLRMKDGCAILSDVALKQKALSVLISYNPAWLKIGLHIVLGSNVFKTMEMDDATSNARARENSDGGSKISFLELFIEKNFFAHAGLAKLYAKNKSIEGLYRDGYDEALGRVILKRFFMLVLALDKLKSQHMLQRCEGIDGLDGGSSLLFRRAAAIKSSRRVLQDFLSNAMHGEGDLLVHLGALGYHVSHVQAPLADYDFEIINLVKDLQDGVRICRLAQLLLKDTSVLLKVKLPSHAKKSQKQNCEIALERLAQAGVPIADEQGFIITVDDIVEGVKDKALMLLWNVMLHLQIPSIVNKERLLNEIIRIEDVQSINEISLTSPTIDILLKWTKVVCAKYDVHVDDFKTSFSNGQALCCLLSYYLPSYLPPSAIFPKRQEIPPSDSSSDSSSSEPFKSTIDIEAAAYNFGLVQQLVRKFGDVPEVLQLADLLDDPSPCEQIVIMYVAFICGHLLSNKQLAVEAIDHGVVQSSDKDARSQYQTKHVEAVIKIQSWYRSSQQRLSFKKVKRACMLIQRSVKAWQQKKKLQISDRQEASSLQIQSHWRGHHQRLVYAKQRAAITLIIQKQIEIEGKIEAMHQQELVNHAQKIQALWKSYKARKSYLRQILAAQKIQQEWRSFLVLKGKISAAVKIQAHVRGYLSRKLFLEQMKAAICIQTYYRVFVERIKYRKCRERIVRIQGVFRSRCIRKNYKEKRQAALKIQSTFRAWHVRQDASKEAEINHLMHASAQKIQASWRWFLQKRMESKKFRAAVAVQATFRAWKARKDFRLQMKKIIYIQSHFRGGKTRREISSKRTLQTLTASSSPMPTAEFTQAAETEEEKLQAKSLTADDGDPEDQKTESFHCSNQKTVTIPWDDSIYQTVHGCHPSESPIKCIEEEGWRVLNLWAGGSFRQRLWFLRARRSAVKIQRWWISVAERRSKAAHIIQKHYIAWKTRKYFKQVKLCTISLQAHWRGFLTRKHMDQRSRELMDLRRRMQNTAATVDSNTTLGNRLKVALAALLDHKTVSGLLKTSATIDMATQHSGYCCEKLAEGGAITKLLQLIQTTNRSPPHEQVLKHALSILGNLARIPDLAVCILKTPASLEIVAEQLQLCRNKEAVFFKAMRVLQLVCATSDCADAIQKRPLILRRLQHLAELLDQKVAAEGRNLERLSERVAFQTRKLAEKKIEEAIAQSQCVSTLLQTLSKHQVDDHKHVHIRKKGAPLPGYGSKRRSSIGIFAPPSISTPRLPLQNCSNKKIY